MSEAHGSMSDLVYLGAGVGTLGVALGVAGGTSAILHKNSAESGCQNKVCPPSTWRDLQTAHNMATVSNVGFAMGGIGLAFVIGLLLFDRPRPVKHGWRVAPEVSQQGAYVNGGAGTGGTATEGSSGGGTDVGGGGRGDGSGIGGQSPAAGGGSGGLPIRINFQPIDAPVPAGYVPDTGLTFAAHDALSFGWNVDHTDVTRDRGVN